MGVGCGVSAVGCQLSAIGYLAWRKCSDGYFGNMLIVGFHPEDNLCLHPERSGIRWLEAIGCLAEQAQVVLRAWFS